MAFLILFPSFVYETQFRMTSSFFPNIKFILNRCHLPSKDIRKNEVEKKKEVEVTKEMSKG